MAAALVGATFTPDVFACAIDVSRDVNETAAIVLDAKRSGGKSAVFICGGGDVYFQQYNAAGLAVDSETRANRYTPSTQSDPAIASMPKAMVATASFSDMAGPCVMSPVGMSSARSKTLRPRS